MAVITIVGAGMMGSALSWPLSDNGHTVRLVGTHLDEEIIASIQAQHYHPKLQRRMPERVTAYRYTELATALEGADVVASGVSSFGVKWFAQTVGPLLRPEVPVIAVTKGLEDQPDGTLEIFPKLTRRLLPEGLRERISLNAIGGPCTSHELAARRQTGVVFCGDDLGVLGKLKSIFQTSYYHIWPSTDVVGVEVCAAMKNAYALAVGIGLGMMEKDGPDGVAEAYNPQAALFAQGCTEMRKMLAIIGGGTDNATWLPGPGDLYVTIFGGRTVKLGRLLGHGHSFVEARAMLEGVTLESVEITTRVARALPGLAARGLARLEDFPLILHIDAIINRGAPVDIPWDKFFATIP